VGEWLEGQWLPAKKKLRAGTVRSYEAHIRLYFLPHIGRIRIDRLQVTDVAAVFEAIDELNDLVEEARADGDPAVLPRSKAGAWSARPPGSGSARPSVRRWAPTCGSTPACSP
jgi:hypothetical protein